MSHMADQFGTLQNSSCKDFMQKFFFNYYNCIIEARRFFLFFFCCQWSKSNRTLLIDKID